MEFRYINDEQKIRMSLSRHAYTIMQDDMRVFSEKRPASFINTVFKNFREDAQASQSAYLAHKRAEFEELFESSDLDADSAKIAVDHMLALERKKSNALLIQYKREKFISKVYHINNENVEFIENEWEDAELYNEFPGPYIKCIIEEYARLPFLKRQRIYRKEVYDVVEAACRTHSLLRVKIRRNDGSRSFDVYPYKIISDPLNMQEYLACFTKSPGASPKEKRDASFSMARLEKPAILKQDAFLSKKNIDKIEEDITNLSVSFLLGESQDIRVRLTEHGRKLYTIRLYSRPGKDEDMSTDEVYVFHCTEQQAYYYFLPFGADAEILSPPSLRERMMKVYRDALQNYGDTM